MTALDTNVVVRFLLGDDTKQAHAARDLVLRGPVLLLCSVLMETEWVLRKSYGLSRDKIASLLAELSGLDQVVLENEWTITRSLEGYRAGLDFANSMHVAASWDAHCFATFDKQLVRGIERLGWPVQVVVPSAQSNPQ